MDPPLRAWGALPEEFTLSNFARADAFAGMLAFDTFVGNCDRHIRNLICREVNSNCWEIYLIDHAHIFANAEWLAKPALPTYPLPDALTPRSVIRDDMPRLAQLYAAAVTDLKTVGPVLTKIEALSDLMLNEFIDNISDVYASSEHLFTMKQILRLRRDAIRTLFATYFDE